MTIDLPSAANATAWVLLVLAVLSAAYTLLRRRYFGVQDHPGRGVIIPQYSLPEDLNPMQAAILLRRPEAAISAQIVSFAVRGNLTIVRDAAMRTGSRYLLQFVHANNTDAQEKVLLGVLFNSTLTPGDTRVIGVANQELARDLHEVLYGVSGFIQDRQLRGAPSSRGGIVVSLLLVVLFIAEVAFMVLTTANNIVNLQIFPALGITFVFIFIALGLSYRRGSLTAKGADVRDYLLGMRDYLTLAEAERFRMMQTPTGADRIDIGDNRQVIDIDEKLLPYAVIWGIEREWTRQVAGHYGADRPAPAWVADGTGAQNPDEVAAEVTGLTSAVAVTIPTPKRARE